MKHIVLSILLSTALLAGFSQFTLGPKIGANFTNIIEKSKFDAGFDAGIFLHFGNAFYFQPEVAYSFRSTNIEDIYDEITNNKYKTHNIDIPLLLGYKFINNENFKFRLFIGPRLGIIIDNSEKTQDKNPVNVLQYGGQVGIGIDFWRFTFDIKYDFSANEYTPVNAPENTEWFKQNMIGAAIGFKIIKH